MFSADSTGWKVPLTRSYCTICFGTHADKPLIGWNCEIHVHMLCVINVTFLKKLRSRENAILAALEWKAGALHRLCALGDQWASVFFRN